MNALSETDLRAIEAEMKGRVEERIMSENRSGATTMSNRASEIGFECDTYHVLRWLRPDLHTEPPLGLRKIFRLGNILETPNIRLIEDSGYTVVEQQRGYAWPSKKITAHVDAKIKVPALGTSDAIPLEHKSFSPNVFRTVRKIYDDGADWKKLLDSSYSFLRHYPAQLQTYELLDGVAYGVWFFFDKPSGDFFFWIHPLDMEYAETLIKRAERINAAVAAGTIPEPKRCGECDSCDYANRFCFVGKDFGPGYDILLDPEEVAEWEAKLTRRAELDGPRKEFEHLDDEIKDRFKGVTSIVGSFLIESKEFERTIYTIPPEMKARFAEKVPAFRMKITRL